MRKRLPIPLLAAVALAAVIAVVVLLSVGDDEEAETPTRSSAQVEQALRDGKVLVGPRAARFAIRYPDTWSRLPPAELGDAEGRALAGLRRGRATGLMTISVRGPVRGGVASLRETLPDELSERFPDFRLVSIRLIDVGAGRALFASWVREESGRVQSTLVVPEGNRRSFAVDTIVPAGAEEAAAEVGAMLRSFDLVDR